VKRKGEGEELPAGANSNRVSSFWIVALRMVVEQVESLLDRSPVTPPSHGKTKKEERKYCVGPYNFVIVHG